MHSFYNKLISSNPLSSLSLPHPITISLFWFLCRYGVLHEESYLAFLSLTLLPHYQIAYMTLINSIDTIIVEGLGMV